MRCWTPWPTPVNKENTMKKFASLALVVASAVTFTACDKAKEVASSVVASAECSALDAAAKGLGATDNLSEGAIKGLSKAAGALDTALKALPTDKLPAGAGDTVKNAIAGIDDAANKFATDPSAAKAEVAKQVASLQQVITDTKAKQSC